MNTDRLAVQMYTVREHTKTHEDLMAALTRISEIGYKAVQISAVGAMAGDSPAVTAKQARKLLDERGLACIATHRDWDHIATETNAEIDFHRELGCSFVAIGSLPGRYRNDGADGYRRFVDDAMPAIAQLKSEGIVFGYHNHAHEFQRIGGSGGCLYDIFVNASNDLALEVDVYWAAHAGLNPERLMERLKGRVPVIHVKDREVVQEGPVMAPIGEGNLDWPHLIPCCMEAGVEWFAVEQDEYRRDPFDCLNASFNYLKELPV